MAQHLKLIALLIFTLSAATLPRSLYVNCWNVHTVSSSQNGKKMLRELPNSITTMKTIATIICIVPTTVPTI